MLADQASSERKSCEWIVADNEDDCVITAPNTPTTMATRGCCAHTSTRLSEKCSGIVEDEDQCNRRASCYFIEEGELETDCIQIHTEPPQDPGCYYGNPDIAHSKRWMESCKAFGYESECLMLKNDDGEPRCTFGSLGEYEDCETVWPTATTTEAVGCYADRYKANDKSRCRASTRFNHKA